MLADATKEGPTYAHSTPMLRAHPTDAIAAQRSLFAAALTQDIVRLRKEMDSFKTLFNRYLAKSEASRGAKLGCALTARTERERWRVCTESSARPTSNVPLLTSPLPVCSTQLGRGGGEGGACKGCGWHGERRVDIDWHGDGTAAPADPGGGRACRWERAHELREQR